MKTRKCLEFQRFCLFFSYQSIWLKLYINYNWDFFFSFSHINFWLIFSTTRKTELQKQTLWLSSDPKNQTKNRHWRKSKKVAFALELCWIFSFIIDFRNVSLLIWNLKRWMKTKIDRLFIAEWEEWSSKEKTKLQLRDEDTIAETDYIIVCTRGRIGNRWKERRSASRLRFELEKGWEEGGGGDRGLRRNNTVLLTRGTGRGKPEGALVAPPVQSLDGALSVSIPTKNTN